MAAGGTSPASLLPPLSVLVHTPPVILGDMGEIDSAKFLSWEESSFFDRWSYRLVTPLVELGTTRPLQVDSLNAVV